MADKRVQIIAEHIQNTIAVVNPNDNARLYTVYAQGFLLGHLASIFERDTVLYREFLEHCDHLAKTRNKKVDTHRK